MLHGRILRSPHPHARIVSIDLSRGREGAGREGGAWPSPKPGEKVMFQGEEIAALAAATEQQARDALRLIKVEYEVLPHSPPSSRRCAPARRRCSRTATSRKARRRRPAISTPASRRPCTRRSHLRDAGADARLARDARLRLRVEGRQPDGVGVDAGGARHARRLRPGAGDPAGQRARDHRVHGRRVRQQVRPRHRRASSARSWRSRRARR